MEIREAIYKRRSVRSFLDKEVDDFIISKLLEDAMAAPSACNKRPWEFYVIKNKKIQNTLKQKILFCNYNSPLMIVVCGNKNNEFSKDDNDYWIQDASAAPKHSNPNLLPIGETFGFVVFLNETA